MNLWIRSQDGEKIVNCNDIVVNGCSIIGYFDKDTEYEDLGTYKSKERALEWMKYKIFFYQNILLELMVIHKMLLIF